MMQIRCQWCGWTYTMPRDTLLYAVAKAQAEKAIHHVENCPKCRHALKIQVSELKRRIPPNTPLPEYIPPEPAKEIKEIVEVKETGKEKEIKGIVEVKEMGEKKEIKGIVEVKETGEKKEIKGIVEVKETGESKKPKETVEIKEKKVPPKKVEDVKPKKAATKTKTVEKKATTKKK